MPKNLIFNTVVVLILLMVFNCANKGSPTGGEKDIIPPVIVKSVPENYSTNFKGKEIRIYFDEFVKIKNLQKQLIISPPMNTQPDITPLGSASKYIKVVINDTLEPNTTYAFNFGQSIVDNNEENPFSYYKYVFSTGNYIDSLSVTGQIFSASSRNTDNFVSVMLYELDSTYTDSTIFKKRPKYITNTLDSTTTFSIENIKEGRYKMVAIKDVNSNYTFQQKTDKIGFYEGVVNIPSDSSYVITLFKEANDPKILNAKQTAAQKILFGFEGDYKDINIDILGEVPEDFESRITKDKKTDTLYYWYKPKLELDSAFFVVRNRTFRDTLKHRFRNLDKDSLVLTPVNSGALDFGKDFMIEANIPLISINKSKIKIIDKDSLEVAFTTEFDSINNNVAFKFVPKESDIIKIQMLPETFKDFFDNTNDTLKYSLRTKNYSDYSNIRAIVSNATYPIIVQLTNEKDEVKYEKIAIYNQPLDFENIITGTYYMRVIIDSNANGKWDSGSFLKNLQPERIIYDPKPIDARANFDFVHDFAVPEKRPDRLKN